MKGNGEVGGVPGLAAARLWAATRFPYLATGLFGTHVIAATEIGTVAVDEGWRMHADPDLAAQWTPAQLGSVVVHHVNHLLRAHGERAAPAGVTPDRAAVWVRCADAEINDDLVPAGLDLPGSPAIPAGLLRWAEEILEPSVNWRKALAAELRRAVADSAGAVDYSYRRPSRRASVAGSVVLPALRRPVPEIAVVCDTSGSMSEDLLAEALAEVEGLLRAVGMARQLRVLACDTAVGPVRRVSSARSVELVGGGGTDMGAGIEAASQLRPRPSITVVLTDGFTPWPDEPPRGMRVVVGLLGEDAPDAPDWARAVRVPA